MAGSRVYTRRVRWLSDETVVKEGGWGDAVRVRASVDLASGGSGDTGLGARGAPRPPAAGGAGARASPRLRGAREDAGQRGQRRGRLAGALESVDEDAGHQRSLQRGRRCAGPAVQVERGAGVQVGNETLRVEIRRREHPLKR